MRDIQTFFDNQLTCRLTSKIYVRRSNLVRRDMAENQ
jgi:hypothetical protein